MGHFAHITWGRNATERNSKTKYKAATEKSSSAGGSCLHTCPNDNDKRACEHSRTASEHVVDWTREEYGGKRTNVIHGKYNTSG